MYSKLKLLIMILVRSLSILSVFSFLVFLHACSSDQIEVVDCDVSGPGIMDSEVIDADCQPTGQITVTPVGGNGQLMYSIDDVNFQSEPTFSNLSSGSYSITVVDAEGCTGVAEVVVGNSGSDLDFTTETTTGGCGAGEGSIVVNATGGMGGYTYRLGTGVFGTSNTFENISGGSYNVAVKDEQGCITSMNVQVMSGVSFESNVKPIIDLNCNVTSCHGNDPALPTFNSYNEIKNSSARIKSVTQSGAMPPEDKLTQNQIDLIACWVDDGAPNN
tara:strand:- start:89 stop:910 length:822 start_codon:yes stop_codon:yes gene_type:complete